MKRNKPSKSDLSLDSVVTQAKELLGSSIDDETVLLSITQSKYYGIDPVGSRIWTLLKSPISVKMIVQTLLTEYDIDPHTCEKDVLTFINELLEEQLVYIADADHE